MVLALSKGRGSTSTVNRACKDVLALSSFANVHCCFRWRFRDQPSRPTFEYAAVSARAEGPAGSPTVRAAP
eukprot:1671873-Pyramimonas_sp.AAC.1